MANSTIKKLSKWTERTATIHSTGNITDLDYTYLRNDDLRLIYIQFSATVVIAVPAHSVRAAISIQTPDQPVKNAIGSGYALVGDDTTYYDMMVLKITGNNVVAISGLDHELPVGATIYGEIIWKV